MTSKMAAPIENSIPRSRRRQTENYVEINGTRTTTDDSLKKESFVFDGKIILLTFVLLYLTMFLYIKHKTLTFPEAKTQVIGAPVDSFYESNARSHLEQFSLHGPRVVGSKANEIFAYNYIMKELQTIKENAISSKNIVIDQQNVTGEFDIEFLSDFVSVYRNIKNIAVLLKAEPESKHSLLMSCHFDSSVDSPGAGDNAISCAIMLEVIRVFSQSTVQHEHNIIFLFNSAEENLMQASHGFITKHPWAESIRTFVNIDSAGVGGWEIVFQTGPAHPWLVRAYAESVPYPSGSIFAQEVFQSGLIPADTDYRIYRDFGEIPGLDIAYTNNGYVYHTQNDLNRFIQPGCLQRGGENMIALLRKLSSSPQLADPGLEKDGMMVFFDLVGIKMIFYPQRVALVINSILVAAILFKIIRNAFNLDRSENHDVKYLRNLLVAILFMALTWIVIMVTCIAMALLVTILGHNMSWFSHNYNIVPLFLLPSSAGAILLHEFIKKKLLQHNSIWYNEKIFFEANLAIWSCLLLYLTVKGIGSAFFPMLMVLGPLLIRDKTLWIFRKNNWRGHPYRFLTFHILSLTIPSLITIYIGYSVLVLFIPIMGRGGSEVNPDIAIGIMCGALVILLTGYLVSLFYLCSNMKNLVAMLGVISALWLLAIVFTPLGFPYSGNPEHPSPLRMVALHTRRQVHNIESTVVHEDAGIWIIPFDFTNNEYLIKAMPRLKTAHKMECKFGPYCGVPFIIPVIAMLHPEKSLYLPVASHSRPEVVCQLVGSKISPEGLTAMSFEITGPDHMTLQVRPHDGVTLERWSLSELLPEPAAMPSDINERTYFVYYSHGHTPSTPWSFTIYLKVPSNHNMVNGIVDMGLAGHYLHSDEKMTKEMDAFLKETPDWSTPVSWAATWDGFVF